MILLFYFNPRTCTRCDQGDVIGKMGSTDFNPRTCTRCDESGRDDRRKHLISIHAPARGAMNPAVVFAGDSVISIHAPARGAIAVTAFKPEEVSISIHAPARGAISISEKLIQLSLNFNPRTCTRCDRGYPSTLPGPSYFNPRTCTRCDFTDEFRHLFGFISIHAPARGAMRPELFDGVRRAISIHAPARGAISSGRKDART